MLLTAYSILYKLKKDIKDFSSLVRVCVYNSTEKNFFNLLDNHSFHIETIKKGLKYISEPHYNSYLINIEEINKKDKELLLCFLSKEKNQYDEIYKQVRGQEYFIRLAEYFEQLVNRRDFMRLAKHDKEWAKRVNWTIDEFVQQMDPKRRLKGLKLEERLEGFTPEEILKGFTPEEILKRFKPEERLSGLKPEDIKRYLQTIEGGSN
jgi:hypothetical protein